jgi:hypothetical protein
MRTEPRLKLFHENQRLTLNSINSIIRRLELAGDLIKSYRPIANTSNQNVFVENLKGKGIGISYLSPIAGGIKPPKVEPEPKGPVASYRINWVNVIPPYYYPNSLLEVYAGFVVTPLNGSPTIVFPSDFPNLCPDDQTYFPEVNFAGNSIFNSFRIVINFATYGCGIGGIEGNKGLVYTSTYFGRLTRPSATGFGADVINEYATIYP